MPPDRWTHKETNEQRLFNEFYFGLLLERPDGDGEFIPEILEVSGFLGLVHTYQGNFKNISVSSFIHMQRDLLVIKNKAFEKVLMCMCVPTTLRTRRIRLHFLAFY